MTMRPVIALFSLLLPAMSMAADVSGFRVWTDPAKTRAVIDLDSRAEYQLFTLEDPHRVVVDLHGSSLEGHLNFESEYAGVITGVRHGEPREGTLRVVLDLEQGTKIKSFLLNPTGQYGHRLVIDLYSDDQKHHGAPKKISDVQTLNRDVVIAIDAGHGGEDPGAIGQNKSREKDVVLAIARKLKATIDERPGMRGVLTRTGDYYVPHRDRFEKARRNRADLFVSIHADAFKKRSVAGGSVFVLNQRGASSEYARLTAAKENKSDLVGGVTLSDKDEMLASVLLDLSQSATMEASNAVAKSIFSSMNSVGKMHKKHVESANFLVLKSPDVPSVLVETAFISNPNEERKLRDPVHQARLANAIASGIQDYFYFSPPPGTWIAANRKQMKYVVVRGDTLGGIATRYQVPLNRLRTANNIKGDVIHIGSTLVIPTT
ncbi:MAG TPA: N-acetylmuramoyl-L-alanine amidase [Xanthomonadales bacterium]|nr:N-acetylmuramoyl-L-alanine amidase [Xanthomonadales bacterium]